MVKLLRKPGSFRHRLRNHRHHRLLSHRNLPPAPPPFTTASSPPLTRNPSHPPTAKMVAQFQVFGKQVGAHVVGFPALRNAPPFPASFRARTDTLPSTSIRQFRIPRSISTISAPRCRFATRTRQLDPAAASRTLPLCASASTYYSSAATSPA